MKNMKTWLSALLAVMMLLAMTGIAMADAVPTGSITVENLEPGETVTIYQVIEIESDGTAALKDPKWVSGIQDWIATEYPEYADIPVEFIDEDEHPEIADQYDYYYVPTYYVAGEKLHEGVATKEKIHRVFERALRA